MTATLPIWEEDILKIGRDPRSKCVCTFCLPSLCVSDTSSTVTIHSDKKSSVSRNHCEVYVIVYEPSVNHIYVRDRKSANGTFVNNSLIGIGPHISSGHLLQDGDTIEIRPYWKFILRQARGPPEHDLTQIQAAECRVGNALRLIDHG